MIGFFSRKVKEQELTLNSTKNTLIIEIDEKNFNEKDQKKLPCIINAQNLFTISGGTAPYSLVHGTIDEGYLDELRTEKGIQFSEGNITQIFFTISIHSLLDLLEKGIKQTKIRIIARDQKYIEKNIELNVNLQHIQAVLQNQFYPFLLIAMQPFEQYQLQ